MDPNQPDAPAAVHEPVTQLPRRRRWLGIVVTVLLLVLLGALAWYLVQRAHTPVGVAGGPPGGGPGRPGGPPPGGPGGAGGRGGAMPNTVGVATAEHADIPVTIDALGTVTALANVTVQPQVSGVLTQVLYKEGQLVKKGDVLAVIDPQPFQIALQQAQGARQRDEASLDAARVQLKRYQALLAQDSIARQTVDTQAALVQQLEGTVIVDRANENTAKLNLSWSRITAPVSGRVGLRPVDAGNVVSSGSTTGVAVITQIQPIDVEFSIPQDRLPEVQQRMAQGVQLPVTVFDRTRLRQLDQGFLSTYDNLIDTTTGTIRAKARFANADYSLFPNQFVNARLLLRTIDAAVVVPVTALRHGPNGDFVFVVNEDKTVTQRPVTAGQSSVDRVAITKGLESGEMVVTEGGDRLRDGSRVQTSVDRPTPAPNQANGNRRQRQGQSQGGAGASAQVPRVPASQAGPGATAPAPPGNRANGDATPSAPVPSAVPAR